MSLQRLARLPNTGKKTKPSVRISTRGLLPTAATTNMTVLRHATTMPATRTTTRPVVTNNPAAQPTKLTVATAHRRNSLSVLGPTVSAVIEDMALISGSDQGSAFDATGWQRALELGKACGRRLGGGERRNHSNASK